MIESLICISHSSVINRTDKFRKLFKCIIIFNFFIVRHINNITTLFTMAIIIYFRFTSTTWYSEIVDYQVIIDGCISRISFIEKNIHAIRSEMFLILNDSLHFWWTRNMLDSFIMFNSIFIKLYEWYESSTCFREISQNV